MFTLLVSLCWLVLCVSRVAASDSFNSSCDCEIFAQSWKTSQIISLNLGKVPQVSESSTEIACLDHCKQQFSLANAPLWSNIEEKSCKVMVFNAADAVGRDDEMSVDVRGRVQCFYKYKGIWKPIGRSFGRVLTCSGPKQSIISKRSLERSTNRMDESDLSNSIDVQSVIQEEAIAIDVEPSEISAPPSPEESLLKRPVMLNISPLRVALKRLGLFGPYVDGVFSLVNRVDIRNVLDRFRMGGLIERYHYYYDTFSDEFDAGHCFVEYVMYTVFNHRFAGRRVSRDLRSDLLGYLVQGASSFLASENSTAILTSIIEQVSPILNVVSEKKPAAVQDRSLLSQSNTTQVVVPDVQHVILSITRFYLRNYFANAPGGSSVRSNALDRNNDADELADMVEQISRPFFISIFGVVPGTPASGRMDERIMFPTPDLVENRSQLDQVDDDNDRFDPPKTGNPFFDVGNVVVGTFQKATDSTHGMYCFKQYLANKSWNRFRGSVRRILKSVPTIG